jgi:hypothetical protein
MSTFRCSSRNDHRWCHYVNPHPASAFRLGMAWVMMWMPLAEVWSYARPACPRRSPKWRMIPRPYTHAFCALDHSSWTVYPATVLKLHAQISPISPLWLSYQPAPGTGSVIASHSS